MIIGKRVLCTNVSPTLVGDAPTHLREGSYYTVTDYTVYDGAMLLQLKELEGTYNSWHFNIPNPNAL